MQKYTYNKKPDSHLLTVPGWNHSLSNFLRDHNCIDNNESNTKPEEEDRHNNFSFLYSFSLPKNSWFVGLACRDYEQDHNSQDAPSDIKNNLNFVLKLPGHKENESQNNHRRNSSLFYIILQVLDNRLGSTLGWITCKMFDRITIMYTENAATFKNT